MSAEAIPDPGVAPADAAAELELRATCAHESGHAVIALVHKLPIRRAVVIQGGRAFCSFLNAPLELDSVAETVARLDVADRTRDIWQMPESWDLGAGLLMLEAGEAAACRVRGRRSDGGWDDRLHGEYALGAAMRRAPWSPEVQHVIAGVARAAEGAVRCHWTWIEATARALLERGVLEVAEVRALRPEGGRR
jgi:hypothetical protein